jgi:bromodomain-containing protein 7/9
MNIVLEYVAGEICRLQQAERDTKVKVEAESAAEETESAVMRNLRLNLLALVKRAPLDTIARLPLDLVPEHIRPFVPTLTSVAGTPAS